MQLIDARPFWVQMEKSLGNKRRRIGDPSAKEEDPDHISELTKIFGAFRDGHTRIFSEEDAITHQPVQRARVVSKISDNEDFGYHKITVERPLRLNFQACAERITRLDDESGFKNLATSAKKDPTVREKEIAAGKVRQEEIRAFVRTLGNKLWSDREAFLLLMVNRSGILRHSIPAAIITREMAINQDIRGCVPLSVVDSKFIAYLIEGNQPALLALWRQQGATVESLTFESVKTTNLHLPDLAEQRAIKAFLDRETGRVDRLAAKKRELIERLKEKRTALISRTVTRGLPAEAAAKAGLPANPPIKPSALDWLGDIPKHWEEKRLSGALAGIPHRPHHRRRYRQD